MAFEGMTKADVLRTAFRTHMITGTGLDPELWEHQPVGIREFIESNHYLDLKDECFEQHKRDLEKLFHTPNPLDREYTEAVLIEGIGCCGEGTVITDARTLEKITMNQKSVGRQISVYRDDGTIAVGTIIYSGKKHVDRYIFSDSRFVDLTKDHPVMVGRSGDAQNRLIDWSPISSIPIGGTAYADFGGANFPLTLKEIVPIGEVDTFDLADCWHFVGNGIVLHNSGKSFIVSVICTYLAYIILCLRNPQATFGLAPGTRIAIMNLSVSATHAANVVYSEIRSKVDRCEWFRRFYPPVSQVRTEVRFCETPVVTNKVRADVIYKNVYIVPGSSTAYSAVGYNLFAGVMDEVTLFKEGGGKDSAEMVHKTLHHRITSRFGRTGLLMMVGSSMYVDDYLERKVKDAQTDPAIFWIRRPVWEAKFTDWKTMQKEQTGDRADWLARFPDWDGQHFYFDTINKVEITEWRPGIWSVPSLYKKDFIFDPDGAMRDLGSLPSEAINTFFHDSRCIYDSVIVLGDEESPVLNSGMTLKPKVQGPPKAICAVHVDLSKMVGGDACGLAVSHFGGWSDEGGAIVIVDLVARWHGTRKNPIPLERIREFIYALTQHGFNIGIVSFDGYQSVDSLQILQKKGYRAELLSVDREPTAYHDFRAAVIEKRLKWNIYTNSKNEQGEYRPCWHGDNRKWTPTEWLIYEMLHLEENMVSGKIDHSPGKCHVGETPVLLADGSTILFKDMHAQSYEIITWNGSKFIQALGERPRITSTVNELIEIEMEDGSVFRCTEDHPYLLESGKWIMAKDIDSGDDIKCVDEAAKRRISV